jgi:hypothetical protein
MFHENHDQVQNEMQQALVLLRTMTGSDLNEAVDRSWMEMLLKMQGPDGLLYYPVVGRPWQQRGVDNPQYGGLPDGEHVTGPYNNGEILGAVALYYLRSGDPLWMDLGARVVDGLTRLGVVRDDTIFYPKGMYGLGELSDQGAPIPSHTHRNIALGWMAQGVLQFARATGHQPAMELAAKLFRFVRYHAGMYRTDGTWLADDPAHSASSHFHAHTYPLIGMLEYALLTGDDDLAEFVRTSYEFGRAHGEPLTGFFPEHVFTSRRETSELCEVGDMVGLALKLSAAGLGDYWDDADRWIRNMFAEGQLRQCDWMVRAGSGLRRLPIDGSYQTDERVGESNVGAFAGWPAPDDFFGAHSNGHNNVFMHCCTANCSRTIYYIWEHILHQQGDRVRVNLLMNRASPSVDVESHIPYEGQVDIKVKQGSQLSVRIPEWVSPEEAAVQVDSVTRSTGWDGRYAEIGAMKPGAVVTITFPIAERTDSVWIEQERYALVRKGNEVVVIDPPGRYAPLYQRDHYRERGARWHQMERFVPEQPIEW